MVKTYYIFRHGETFATKANSGYGYKIFSAHILDEGKPVIEKLAKYLANIETDFNASSQIRRCRETVQIITQETNKQFDFDSRLNEFFFEPIWFFKRRVRSLLKELDRKGYESVAICTHGAVIAALTNLITRGTFELANISHYPQPGKLVIIKENQLTEIDFNES